MTHNTLNDNIIGSQQLEQLVIETFHFLTNKYFKRISHLIEM